MGKKPRKGIFDGPDSVDYAKELHQIAAVPLADVAKAASGKYVEPEKGPSDDWPEEDKTGGASGPGNRAGYVNKKSR